MGTTEALSWPFFTLTEPQSQNDQRCRIKCMWRAVNKWLWSSFTEPRHREVHQDRCVVNRAALLGTYSEFKLKLKLSTTHLGMQRWEHKTWELDAFVSKLNATSLFSAVRKTHLSLKCCLQRTEPYIHKHLGCWLHPFTVTQRVSKTHLAIWFPFHPWNYVVTLIKMCKAHSLGIIHSLSMNTILGKTSSDVFKRIPKVTNDSELFPKTFPESPASIRGRFFHILNGHLSHGAFKGRFNLEKCFTLNWNIC